MTSIFRGDSETALITVDADLNGWTVKILFVPASSPLKEASALLPVDCSYIDATHVKMEMTAAQSATLPAGTYNLLLRAKNADGSKRKTAQLGQLTVNPDPDQES